MDENFKIFKKSIEDAAKEPDIKGFIADLTQLTQKYGIAIGGCGCCGSPYLETQTNILNEDLEYDWNTQTYSVR